jgi:hypothetical protein
MRLAMKRLLFFISGILVFTAVTAQDIAIGNWQSHYSFTSAQHVVQTKNRIFCSTYNGLFSVNSAGRQIKIHSKSDGLNDVGISNMAYDSVSKTLLIAYRSSNVDVVQLDDSSDLGAIINIPVLQNTSGLPGVKRIYKILFQEKLAYLATNFGIVVLDTETKDVAETYRYIGNGGSEANVTDLAFTTDSLFAVTTQGLLGTSMKSSVNRQYFANWKQVSTPANPTAAASRQNKLYAGFPKLGIFRRDSGKWISIYPSTDNLLSLSLGEKSLIATLQQEIIGFDVSDHPVSYKDSQFVLLSGTIRTSADILWVADRTNGLISNLSGKFQLYSETEGDTTIAIKPDSSIIDLNGLVWSRLPSYLGGGISVSNTKTGQQRVLSTVAGNGGLPSSTVNSIVVDNDGYVWFGSDKGVGYFIPDEILAGARIDAVLPIYGQRKLFNTEICTALAVEPGNRKWLGTRSGLYLFNADGTELISHFMAADSPLPSDIIKTLRFEPVTGQLFADTPNGMVSYRSNATTPAENFSKVTIFPNPVRPGYSGSLGIKGLTANSTVKITTLSGRLVFETRSQGGTASWNLSDYTGRRAAGGIYIVMTISEDKSAKFVGKFAIID